MQAASRRTGTLLLAGLAAVSIGCQTLPVEGQHPVAHRSGPGRVAQGAILGGMAGAALGAGLDHRDRGRGALIGAVGGLLAGALLGGGLERHEAWHRDHVAHVPHGGDLVWCEEHQAWEEPGDWGYDDGTGAPPGSWQPPAGPADRIDPIDRIGLAPPDVLFEAGSADLSPGAKSHLRRVAERVRRDADLELLLRGHTDGSGSEAFALSERRARSVRAYLAAEGVPARRIAWVGFGDIQPVASTRTAEGRRRNRRVEVVLRARDRYGAANDLDDRNG